MKNLNEMGLKEMSTQEMQKVDGGLVWYGAMALAWVGHILYETVNDWGENVKSYHKGYQDAKKILDENNVLKN